MIDFIQYVPAWLLLKALGLLPRRAAFAAGCLVGRLAYHLGGGLRHTGVRNLEMAMPELDPPERRRIVRREFEGLGRLLGAFSQFPRARRGDGLVAIRGAHHVEKALAEGRGVLLLTAHLGGWELGPFGLHLEGYPHVNFLVRRIDNPRVEALAERYRTLNGNRAIDKRHAARQVLAALRRNEMVGILADINVLADEGVFVDFFGRQACTTTGVAVFALRTNAAVIPAFVPWDEREGRYAVTFEEPVELVRTGSTQDDVRINTERFAKVIEEVVRRYPDQWLWIHKRWKTRPEGEAGVY